MARKKKQEEGGLTGDEWLGTYSDCVTLLLTFFILLYSMSSVDAQKVKAISQAFSVMTGQSANSILDYQSSDANAPIVGGEAEKDKNGKGPSEQSKSAEGKMYDKVKDYMKKNKMTASIADVKADQRGIVIELRDNVLFESGQAELKEGSADILNKVNALISTLPNKIVIEGHTDNVPISTAQFPSNWELSTMRATTVLRYFTDECGQDASRLSAAGYADTKPLVENTSDENRLKNRRVNILIITNNEE